MEFLCSQKVFTADIKLTTVKPCYFESRSYENPGFFELYPKSRQKLNFIVPKIVPLFRVSKIRKFEHEGQSRASDNLLNLIV